MGKTTVVLDEELVRDAINATELKVTRELLETGPEKSLWGKAAALAMKRCLFTPTVIST